jgi:hypothetical protein
VHSIRDIARSGKQLVHVGHAVTITRPFDQLSAWLIEAPRIWFPRSIGVHLAGIPIRKRIAVEFGEAVKTSTWAVIRVNWKATFPQRLFPTMEGKVSLSPQGNGVVKLTVSGVYEPPLGRIGEDLNDAVLHSIAEVTVRELAESIAKRLEKATRPS